METGDFTKLLFSPPVLIGGAIVGVLILAMHGSSSATPSGVDPNVLSATVAMNQAATQGQIQLASIAAQSGAARLNADNIQTGQILSYLSNINNNNAVVQGKLIDSQTGITQAAIQTGAAIQIDQNNNWERLNQAYVAANVAQQQDITQVKIAGIQSSTAKALGTDSLIGSITGGLFGAVSSVATGGMSSLIGGITGSNSGQYVANSTYNNVTPGANQTLPPDLVGLV